MEQLSIERLKHVRAFLRDSGYHEGEKALDELIAIREAQGVPVGKFVFEPSGQRWHHIKHGEHKYAEPKLPMVKLFTAPQKLVLRPRIEPCLKQVQFERDCEWIAAIEAAGGKVKHEI